MTIEPPAALAVQDRFLTEFGDPEAPEDQADADDAAAATGKQPKGSKKSPPEHQALFAGNTDDHFRLGIKITRQARSSGLCAVCCFAGGTSSLVTHLRLVCSSLSNRAVIHLQCCRAPAVRPGCRSPRGHIPAMRVSSSRCLARPPGVGQAPVCPPWFPCPLTSC